MSVRLVTELALAPLRMTTATVNGWSRYAARNLSVTGTAGPVEPGLFQPGPFQPGPFQLGADLASWWAARSQRRRPSWAHPSTIVHRWPLARLRDYSTDQPSVRVPTLVLPPQAGHDSCIVDYAPGQSQLLTLRDAGLDRLYCLDWAGATEHTAHASIGDYLAVLADTVALVGGPVNLVGDCQGGWLATLYAALYPDQVNTLTVAGAPIDTHAGSGPLLDWTRLLAGLGERAGFGSMAGYRAMVALGGGVQRGANQLLGFMLLEPAAAWERDMALLANIHDPEYVARYIEFADWFAWTQDLPGEFYLWIVEHLFQRNELAEGTLHVEGRAVRLPAIDCPLFLLAGSHDHITPAAQVWALAGLASTPSELVHRELVDGGHLGLFMGREALRQHWAPLAAKLLAHSA